MFATAADYGAAFWVIVGFVCLVLFVGWMLLVLVYLRDAMVSLREISRRD